MIHGDIWRLRRHDRQFRKHRSMLMKALPKERVSQIMEEIRGPAGRTMWDKLGNVNEEMLASYLKNEYPQTVAVVLSKIRPDHAARVLSILPDSFAMEVVMRMLRMEAVQKDVLDGVERPAGRVHVEPGPSGET